MAAAKSRTMPVGSSQWVQSEREQAADMVQQEVEEFSFSVRNELEWLNEHMADIFSTDKVNFADMFKTPGKLRGKTPRTARKVNALVPRQPLTDIFAPNAQPAPAPPSPQKNPFYAKVAQFQIPEDSENRVPLGKPVSRGTSPQRAGKPYTDSGYHGMMTEDEMELEMLTQTDTIATSSQFGETQKVPVRDNQPPAQRLRDGKGDDTGASDDSFVSAKEQGSQDIETAPAPDVDMENVPGDTQPWTQEEVALVEEVQQLEEAAPVLKDQPMLDAQLESQPENDKENDVDMEMEDASNHSDASSPEKPLNRKSSFTFSSLPAREPLTAKRSMGHMDAHRSSVFNKSVGTKHAESQNDEQNVLAKPADVRAHSRTTAQMLHDRINLLGKTKEPRPSKSIPSIALAAQTAYPQLPGIEQHDANMDKTFEFPQKTPTPAGAPVEDDEDDWIAPTKPAQALYEKASEATITQATHHLSSPARPAMHQKSISTTIMPSPTRAEMAPETRLQKTMSVSNPNLAEALDSTTPIGSPARKGTDGPLSASKSRLWSALKSAKNIFASSASTSAAAKLEAHNNSPALMRSPTRDTGDEPHKLFNIPGAIWSKTDVLQSPVRNNSVISFSPSRKTRHSNESEKRREKELKAQEKAAAELEKAREKERQKAAKQQAEEKAKADKAAKAEAAKLEKEEKERQQVVAKAAAEAERPTSANSEKTTDSEKPPPPPSKSGMMATGKLRAPGRLMRPTKESSKAAPVNIRVASQAQRAAHGPSAPSSFSKSQYGDLASSTASMPSGPRAGSAQGHRPGTAGGNSRLRALEAAARKKEADEKAAQEKADKKRELERKRAEKVELEKKAEEERKAAEQQRIQESKLAAQRKAAEKQAAEQRKREQERAEQQRREQERIDQRREQERFEQQRRDMERARLEEEARKAKDAHDLAEAIRREREQKMQAQPRGDLPGTLRQLTKNTVPAVNPAKPAKRQLPAEDDAPQQQQRPGILRGPPSYQQTDAKRRRTNEEQDDQPHQRNSVMAPPKRPSTLRKETMNKFSGYTHAPPPAQHHASMFKATVTAQHQMQHKPTHPSQLVQTSNARIPFAESSNPPAPHHLSSNSSHYDASKFKTPARPQQAPKSAKTTPHYPQGDNIELPDIATDSEDEDSEDETGGFRAPSWTASPALRELLTQQQLVDPEAVFGPIPDLKMDEVFKNSKNQERLKRFRERGSSAMWVETGDAVTSAEKKRDMELRERVVREGGWRYEPHA